MCEYLSVFAPPAFSALSFRRDCSSSNCWPARETKAVRVASRKTDHGSIGAVDITASSQHVNSYVILPSEQISLRLRGERCRMKNEAVYADRGSEHELFLEDNHKLLQVLVPQLLP
jgi:hypothetical protein